MGVVASPGCEYEFKSDPLHDSIFIVFAVKQNLNQRISRPGSVIFCARCSVRMRAILILPRLAGPTGNVRTGNEFEPRIEC